MSERGSYTQADEDRLQAELQERLTGDTVKVVYAVRLSFRGGQAELEKIDQIIREAIEAAFPRDPLLRITRGDTVDLPGNPYPSAGFLHDGSVRIADIPGPVSS